MNDKNFEKIKIKIDVSIQQSTSVPNSRFWEQICQTNMNEKDFKKVNIKTVISIEQFIPLRNFSQFEETQIMGLNLLKNFDSQKF